MIFVFPFPGRSYVHAADNALKTNNAAAQASAFIIQWQQTTCAQRQYRYVGARDQRWGQFVTATSPMLSLTINAIIICTKQQLLRNSRTATAGTTVYFLAVLLLLPALSSSVCPSVRPFACLTACPSVTPELSLYSVCLCDCLSPLFSALLQS